MTEVVALNNFQHNGAKRVGAQFDCSPQAAAALAKKGLVEIIGDGPTLENPTQTAGASASVSPADPVSPEETAPKSKRGRQKKETEE